MNSLIPGNQIFLKKLRPECVTQEYLNWLNDKEVCRFLESKINQYTINTLKEYVYKLYYSQNDILFGIFIKDSDKHIGNIKIGGMNHEHKYADVGLLIGYKKLWGKGYGSEAIGLVTQYTFKKLHLHKLIAGILASNIGSYKAFIRSGYNKVGCYKEHCLCDGEYVDKIIVEKINNYHNGSMFVPGDK